MTAEERKESSLAPTGGRPVFPDGRGYSWPPFQPGHQLSRRHGAHTPQIIEPMAADLVEWLLTLAARPDSPIDFVSADHFAPTLDKWARAEARRLRYEADVAEHGEFDTEGNERPEFRALRDWETRATGHASRLGLDPPSLARIRRELGEANREHNADAAYAELQARYGLKSRASDA